MAEEQLHKPIDCADVKGEQLQKPIDCADVKEEAEKIPTTEDKKKSVAEASGEQVDLYNPMNMCYKCYIWLVRQK